MTYEATIQQHCSYENKKYLEVNYLDYHCQRQHFDTKEGKDNILGVGSPGVDLLAGMYRYHPNQTSRH